MDLFTNSSENTDSELSYDDDDELTNLNEHLKLYNYEPSCQPRKDFISNSENDEDYVSSDSNQEHSRKEKRKY